MDIRDVVKSIMETDVQAFVLYRSMTNYRSSVIITRRLNELIADEPDLQDVAVALAIYPALKWSMHGADADVVMSRMCKSDEELRRLGNALVFASKGIPLAPRPKNRVPQVRREVLLLRIMLLKNPRRGTQILRTSFFVFFMIRDSY